MKSIRVTEIVKKKKKIKGVWDELETEKGFQRQPVTKYLGLTLVFVCSSTLRERPSFVFQEFFDRSNKTFNLAYSLGTALSLFEV